MKNWHAAALATAMLAGPVAEVLAQLPAGFPARPVRMIVGFPPGGTNDIIARLLGQKLSEQVGQAIVIENRGGANTAIASEVFVRSAPDGYTILQVAPGHATNPSMMKLKFDPIKDFGSSRNRVGKLMG